MRATRLLPLLIAALLTASLAACDTGHGYVLLSGEAERTETAVLDLRTGDELIVELTVGSIRVEVSPSETPSVTTTLSVRAPDDEQAAELLATARLAIERRPDGLHLLLLAETETFTGSRSSQTVTPSGDLSLVVPAGTRVRLVTGTGDLNAVGPLGEVLARTSFGGIFVDGTRGAIVLHTGRGDIKVEDVESPRCVLSASFGQVDVDGSFGELRATASSGGVRVVVDPGSLVSEPWHLAARFGDVHLELPRSVSCRIEATSIEGAIVAEIPLAGAVRRSDPTSLAGDHGSGGKVVSLHTGSGTVRIERAQTP